MEVTRITTVEVLTNDGQKLEIGNTVIYSTKKTDGTSVEDSRVGIYNGINNRGCLEIISLLNGDDIVRIFPKSIDKIYLATVNIFHPDIKGVK